MRPGAEKAELAIIGCAVAGLALFGRRLPETIELGSLVAVCALGLLGQGLVRDLHVLASRRTQAPTEEAACMCVESTIGLGAVLAGVFLTALGVAREIRVPSWLWPILGLCVWLAGYAIKDWVIQWSPWRLRRIKDHGSMIVRWRAGRRS